MPWYRAGSVAVTNGSATVTGAGTDFVGNTQAGEVFLGPDGRVYEISAVQSATQLTIIPAYQGASAGGQAYAIQPTASFARDLAVLAAQLLNTFGAVRDGVGQGLFPDGSLAAPAMRFAADQDTGITRVGPNALALVAGGIARAVFGPSGDITMTNASGPSRLALIGDSDTDAAVLTLQDYSASHNWNVRMLDLSQGGSKGASFVVSKGTFGNNGSDFLTLTQEGNLLLVGTAAGPAHTITKSGLSQGQTILGIDGGAGAGISLWVNRVNANAFNGGQPAALMIGNNTANGRSISAGGTINANGADYAEYMLKADGCGIIAKGDVCGVDRDGKLTKTWVDAISFVIKSTDPSLVGGDTWAAHLRPKPEEPGAEPQAPILPAAPAATADEALIAAWSAAQAAYPALVTAYQAGHAEWQQAMSAYAADFAAWEAELESARQCVDRVAFCGQVPCNVTGAFDVGDYIIAAAAGAGIKAIAVKPDEITLPQYMRRIGKVWAVRDGRAWIDVQHG